MARPEPALRHAHESDLDGLAVLEQATFPTHPWTRRALAEELGRNGAIAIVAEGGQRIDGAALGWTAGGVCELTRISVAPHARRRGLGRRLLAEFDRRAAATGADEAWLEVRADNDEAIPLYRSAGYAETGRRGAYYADGCDAVLMARRLPGVRNPG